MNKQIIEMNLNDTITTLQEVYFNESIPEELQEDCWQLATELEEVLKSIQNYFTRW